MKAAPYYLDSDMKAAQRQDGFNFDPQNRTSITNDTLSKDINISGTVYIGKTYENPSIPPFTLSTQSHE